MKKVSGVLIKYYGPAAKLENSSRCRGKMAHFPLNNLFVRLNALGIFFASFRRGKSPRDAMSRALTPSTRFFPIQRSTLERVEIVFPVPVSVSRHGYQVTFVNFAELRNGLFENRCVLMNDRGHFLPRRKLRSMACRPPPRSPPAPPYGLSPCPLPRPALKMKQWKTCFSATWCRFSKNVDKSTGPITGKWVKSAPTETISIEEIGKCQELKYEVHPFTPGKKGSHARIGLPNKTDTEKQNASGGWLISSTPHLTRVNTANQSRIDDKNKISLLISNLNQFRCPAATSGTSSKTYSNVHSENLPANGAKRTLRKGEIIEKAAYILRHTQNATL